MVVDIVAFILDSCKCSLSFTLKHASHVIPVFSTVSKYPLEVLESYFIMFPPSGYPQSTTAIMDIMPDP